MMKGVMDNKSELHLFYYVRVCVCVCVCNYNMRVSAHMSI